MNGTEKKKGGREGVKRTPCLSVQIFERDRLEESRCSLVNRLPIFMLSASELFRMQE